MKRIFISDLHLDIAPRRPDPAPSPGSCGNAECQATQMNSTFSAISLSSGWAMITNHPSFKLSVLDAVSAALELPGISSCTAIATSCSARLSAKLAGADTTARPARRIYLLGDRPALLMHGDSLCTRDGELICWPESLLAGQPAFQQDFLSQQMHWRERAAIARTDSRREQANWYPRDTADDIMDVTPEEVVERDESGRHLC